MYPRVWDNERIDLPIIDKSGQHTRVTAQQIEFAINNSRNPYQSLYALLAASGLRIGEALALRCQPHHDCSHFDGANARLVIKTSMWRGTEQAPKTPSAIRTVELHSQVSKLLADFVGSRDGFLFGNGHPLKEFTARGYSLRRNLPGFHAFRRFRITHLRSQQVPEEIIKALVGHSSGSITDLYSRFGKDESARREYVEKAGIGFKAWDRT